MSLSDYITGDELYNPHVRVYEGGNSKIFLSMNSTTFGERGQSNLILPRETSFGISFKKELHKVTAVVVEQSSFGYKRPQISGDVLSETLMGYITKDTLNSLKTKDRE